MPARPTIVITVLAAIAVAALPTTASAATRYAAPYRFQPLPGGAPCTDPAKPCTIVTALASAVNGDDVSLAAGSYTKGFVFLGDTPSFTDTLTVPNGVTMHGASSTNLPVIYVQPDAQAEAGVQVGTNATIRDVEIRGTAKANTPIAYSLSVFQGTADRVRVRTTAAPGALLISCSLASGTIRSSACLGSGSEPGAKVTGVSASVKTATYTIRNVTAITTVPDSVAINTGTSNGVSTLNISNVVARGTSADISVRAGIAGGSAVANVDHSNWRTQSVTAVAGASAQLVQTGPNQNGATVADPVFVDAGAGDFRQAAGSPTIDAGVLDLGNGPLALGGADRTIGTTTDIGADEFDPASVLVPMPPVAGPGTPAAGGGGGGGGEAGSSGGQTPGAGDTVAPRVTGLTLARSFNRRSGTTVRFTLSEAATVTLTFAQPRTGRRVGGRCRTKTKANAAKPRCSIAGVRGKITISGQAGLYAARFKGQLSKTKRLAVGSYRLTASAVDGAGNVGTPASRRFTLKR